MDTTGRLFYFLLVASNISMFVAVVHFARSEIKNNRSRETTLTYVSMTMTLVFLTTVMGATYITVQSLA